MEFLQGNGPVYRRIADALACAIADGRFAPGARLPPQREIAREAGVNPTTITRAFAELQDRGLVNSRPGRGSIVADPRGRPGWFRSAPSDEAGFVDLSVNRPPTAGYLNALARILPKLPNDPRYAALQDFHSPEGPAWAREVIGGWFAALSGLPAGQDVVITSGAQHGLACTLGAIAQPGDAVLCDEVTYQGFDALCRSLGIRPVPVGTDEGGMCPDSLERAVRETAARAIFLVPTLHNPTTITLSAERRRQIVAAARCADMLVIEDDVCRALKPGAPESVASFAPDITVHIGSFSKSVAPGLRLGAVFAPPQIASDIAAMLRIGCWSSSPLEALVAVRLIEEGHAERIVTEQRAEFAVRQRLVREMLGAFGPATDEDAAHAWLPLPEPWRAGAFVRACARQGVGVLSGEAFAVARDAAPHAVRINVAAARSDGALKAALSTIGMILSGNSKLVDISA